MQYLGHHVMGTLSLLAKNCGDPLGTTPGTVTQAINHQRGSPIRNLPRRIGTRGTRGRAPSTRTTMVALGKHQEKLATQPYQHPSRPNKEHGSDARKHTGPESGLEDKELEWYLDENPRIVPLFEIDIGETTETYASPIDTTTRDEEPSEETIAELQHAQEAFKCEMEISRWVTTTTLEEINDGTAEAPLALSVAKDLPPTTRATMIKLLQGYKDVFA